MESQHLAFLPASLSLSPAMVSYFQSNLNVQRVHSLLLRLSESDVWSELENILYILFSENDTVDSLIVLWMSPYPSPATPAAASQPTISEIRLKISVN